MRSGIRTLLMLLWGAALLIGGYALVLRLTQGHRPAAYGSYVVWGLGVAQYIYFAGLSAGAFILSILHYGFGWKRLEGAARPALLVACVGLIAGLLSIWLDLGHMGRAFLVLIRPNFSSMMTWMIWLYTAYAIVLAAMTYLAWKGDRRVKTLALVGLPLVVGFSGGAGALFATVTARPVWNSGLYPVLFLLGALLSASGLLLGLLAFQERQTSATTESIATLSKLAIGLLAADLVLEWAEYSVALWNGSAEAAALSQTLSGPYWWVFWIIHILLGAAVPIALLLFAPRSKPAAGISGFLVAATYLAVRLNIVIPGQITPELQGLERSFTGNRLSFTYSPAAFEWGIFLFAVAVAVGLLWAGYRYLLVSPATRKEGKAV